MGLILRKEKLCLDYGHGLPDSGAVGLNSREDELVFKIGKRVKYHVERHGVNVIETRKDTHRLIVNSHNEDLLARAKISNDNKATHFISLHMNAFSDRLVRGCEVFTSTSGGERNEMAQSVLSNLISDHNFPNRGVKHARFSVLVNTNAPACLIEIEFITNLIAETYVDKYYEEIAISIAKGYLSHINVDWKENSGREQELTIEEKVNILWNEREGSTPSEKEVIEMFVNLKLGDRNDRVRQLQSMLNKTGESLATDGSFGNLTRGAVLRFQRKSGLTETGIVDERTWGMLVNYEPPKEVLPTTPFSNLSVGMNSDRVRELQFNLNRTGNYNLTVDGSFGNLTRNVVVNFQGRVGIPNSGTVNMLTWSRLLNTIKDNPWRFMRLHSTNISYAVLPKSEYHLGLEFGIGGAMRTVRDRVREVVSGGKKPVCAINAGFFGGVIKNLGLILDYGSYRQVPDTKFMDLLYRKDNDSLEIHDFGSDTPIRNIRDNYHWGIGTSWSLLIDSKPNTAKSNLFSHSSSKHPRTAVGQRDNGDIILMVADGRWSQSLGLTAQQTVDVMRELGCVNAVNLDGGGSTTAVEMIGNNPRVVNRVSDGSERRVGSVLIAYKK